MRLRNFLIMPTKQQIVEMNIPEIIEITNADFSFSEILPLNQSKLTSLSYANNESHLDDALNSSASVLIISEKLKEKLKISDKHLIVSKCPEHTMSCVSHMFFSFNLKENLMSKIADTSKIGTNSALPDNIAIGDFSIIGDNVSLGDNVFIGPHCVIEDNVKIGDNSIIYSNVVIGKSSQIGKSCRIQSHTVIASSGFVYDQESKTSHRPEKNVILENNVELGSNCTIDRGLKKDTIIKQGVKIDNKVQVSSDVEIGANSLITADNTILHNTKLGNFTISGGCNVFDSNISTADQCTFTAASKIDKNISESGSYGGHPLQPVKEYFRTLMTITNLSKLRKELNQIKAKLK